MHKSLQRESKWHTPPIGFSRHVLRGKVLAFWFQLITTGHAIPPLSSVTRTPMSCPARHVEVMCTMHRMCVTCDMAFPRCERACVSLDMPLAGD